MMRSALVWLVLGAGLLIGCPGPRTGPGDAGPDSGVPVDAGPAPEDRVFSLGLVDNYFGPPQAAPVVQLTFVRGTPGPDKVVARRVATAPTLDGDAAEWSAIEGSTIPLQSPGAAIGLAKAEWDGIWGDAGYSAVYDFGLKNAQVKAAFDDANIYFLVSWDDATENRWRQEWILDGGWSRQSAKNEDRLTMAFNLGKSMQGFEAVGCAAACHVKERLGDISTAGLAYRFLMHTADAGEKVDVWYWKATRTNPLGLADDHTWNDLRLQNDGPTDFVITNTKTLADGGAEPRFMAAGGVNSNVDYIFEPDAGSPAAVPFDGTGALPGARIPGYVLRASNPNRIDVRAQGKWAAGKWTVEFRRALTNSDPNDVQFPLQ